MPLDLVILFVGGAVLALVLLVFWLCTALFIAWLIRKEEEDNHDPR